MSLKKNNKIGAYDVIKDGSMDLDDEDQLSFDNEEFKQLT
jgi:hypothetical protein